MHLLVSPFQGFAAVCWCLKFYLRIGTHCAQRCVAIAMHVKARASKAKHSIASSTSPSVKANGLTFFSARQCDNANASIRGLCSSSGAIKVFSLSNLDSCWDISIVQAKYMYNFWGWFLDGHGDWMVYCLWYSIVWLKKRWVDDGGWSHQIA